jgi:hypothetical protein
MPPSAKRSRTARILVLSLLSSLALHGGVFLALWFWPASKADSPLALESTRVVVNACILDPSPAALVPQGEAAPVEVGSVFAAELREAAPLSEQPSTEMGPTLVQDPPPRPARGASEQSSSGAEGPGGGDLFPLPAQATSIVYVLDRSISMAFDRKLDSARRELIASLRRLPGTVRFQVIAYNHSVESLVVDGRRDLLPAESAIVEKAAAFLQSLEASGNTNHVAALRRALQFRADAIYLLTDADDLKPQDLAVLARLNQHSAIHTLELTRRRAATPQGPLAELAGGNRGTFRRVWVGE